MSIHSVFKDSSLGQIILFFFYSFYFIGPEVKGENKGAVELCVLYIS